MNYLAQVNAPFLFLIVALVLSFVTLMCIVFLVKSYRAGIAIGMERKVLKRTITASATFTVLPSISILLGVIALSGSLGLPFSWLRLSVIGNLQYELNVAEIAANSLGRSGLKASELSIGDFTTIGMVMTVGIISGMILSIFVLKQYLFKVQSKPKTQNTKGPGFGAYATIAMFVGLCSAYISSYIGAFTIKGDYMPITVALISAFIMAIFEYLTIKKQKAWLDNFSLAVSMLLGMIAAVLINL